MYCIKKKKSEDLKTHELPTYRSTIMEHFYNEKLDLEKNPLQKVIYKVVLHVSILHKTKNIFYLRHILDTGKNKTIT